MSTSRADEVTIETIRTAAEQIGSQIRRTPTYELQAAGRGLLAKFENQQVTGSFKLRGALNRMGHLSEGERKRGVVTASTGNHARGVARAARMAGIDATVVMPEGAPAPKIEYCRQMGSRVILTGEGYEEALTHATEIEADEGLTFVSSFDDAAVIAGAGTVALEFLDDAPRLDTVVVPIGGGGIISGVATVIQTRSPETRVVGIQAAGANSIGPSIGRGEIVELESVDTIADGIALKRVGDLPFEIIRERVDEFATVTDGQIANAMRFLGSSENQIVEPAGAVTVAAVRSGSVELADDETALAVVTGGNASKERVRETWS